MINFKPDPDFGPGSHVEDLTPIPQHEFTQANQLHLFPFDDSFTVDLTCPDCDAICEPGNLGEAVDWALGHECGADRETAATAREE